MIGSGDKMVTTREPDLLSAQKSTGQQKAHKGKPAALVKFGSAAVPVYRITSGKRIRFTISYHRDGKRLRQVFPSLDAAKKEAQLVAQRIQSGMQHVTDMRPHDRDAYMAATEMLAKLGIPLVAAVEDYVRSRSGQAKTASRRLIPIPDNLIQWLTPPPRVGRVIASCQFNKEVSALARALKIGWPHNVLRHSFISCRIAKIKSADQVALEAGNSPSIIFKHYRELTTEEQADQWFAILPKAGQWETPSATTPRHGR